MPAPKRLGGVYEIPMDQLEIGMSQVRTDANKGIEELAHSIKTIGLIEPIVVKKIGEAKYEILTGQRRFLAHKLLSYDTIQAVVIERDVDEREAKVISLTENLVREDLTQKEKINACTALYKMYGDFKIVAEETGLRRSLVKQYVKYEQLVPKLKELVDGGKADIRIALQAQRAAETSDGEVDEDAAVKFAQEMAPMSGVQRGQFVKGAESDRDAPAEEKIEKGRRQPKLKQIVVTLEAGMHKRLQNYAKSEGMSQDDAASTLLERALADVGANED